MQSSGPAGALAHQLQVVVAVVDGKEGYLAHQDLAQQGVGEEVAAKIGLSPACDALLVFLPDGALLFQVGCRKAVGGYAGGVVLLVHAAPPADGLALLMVALPDARKGTQGPVGAAQGAQGKLGCAQGLDHRLGRNEKVLQVFGRRPALRLGLGVGGDRGNGPGRKLEMRDP